MNLAFLNIGTIELVVIVLAISLIIAVANYGRDTALGYWGSLALSLITSPVVAFIVILFLKKKTTTTS